MQHRMLVIVGTSAWRSADDPDIWYQTAVAVSALDTYCENVIHGFMVYRKGKDTAIFVSSDFRMHFRGPNMNEGCKVYDSPWDLMGALEEGKLRFEEQEGIPFELGIRLAVIAERDSENTPTFPEEDILNYLTLNKLLGMGKASYEEQESEMP